MIRHVKPNFFHTMAWKVYHSEGFGDHLGLLEALTQLFTEMDEENETLF